MQHSIFGIKIKSRPACIIAGTSFILIAVFLLFIGGIEILIGLTETMPVKGFGVDEQLNIHNALSPVFYMEGILILSGGLLLINNGLKFLLNKSLLRFFLRHAVLSSILLFFAILLMQASLLYIWREGTGGPKFKMLLFPIIFFAVSFLLYFAWKKIFKRKAAKDYWALLPVFTIIISLLALTGILANTHYHSDADEAAKAFASASVYQVKNSSTLLFAETNDGQTHIASLTPELTRALRRYTVRIPKQDAVDQSNMIFPELANTKTNGLPSLDDIPQMPTPGWTPLLLLLLTIIGYPLLKAAKNSWSYLALPGNILLMFGLLNLYLLFWFAIAPAGSLADIFYFLPKTSPYNIIPGMLLVSFICGITLIAAVKNRLGSAAPNMVKKGWICFFYFMNLFTIGGIYALSFKNNGNPVLPWLFCYVLLSAGSCLLALNSQKESV